MNRQACIKAIKETYPQIDWARFEDIDSALNGNLWYGPDYNEFLKDNPLENYEWKGYSQAENDLREILEPIPWEMWFDIDGECVVTDRNPENDDTNWLYHCSEEDCEVLLRWRLKDGKSIYYDYEDDYERPHIHEPDLNREAIWFGGEWMEINPRRVLMFEESFKQVF